MLLFLKEMLKCMGDGEEILIYLIRSHTLCDLKSQGVEQMCEHHRYLLASHGALDDCHSWRRVDAKTSSHAPGGAWGVEFCLWSQQNHRIIPGLLSCSREIPSTWNWGWGGRAWADGSAWAPSSSSEGAAAGLLLSMCTWQKEENWGQWVLSET